MSIYHNLIRVHTHTHTHTHTHVDIHTLVPKNIGLWFDRQCHRIVLDGLSSSSTDCVAHRLVFGSRTTYGRSCFAFNRFALDDADAGTSIEF